MHRSDLPSRRTFGTALVVGSTILLGGSAAAQGRRQLTPQSDEGPFYPITLPADSDADLVHVTGRRGRAAGRVIEVRGRLLDRRGNPVTGGQIDIWQANSHGRYFHPAEVSTAARDPNFEGFARLRVGSDGAWRITTIKPGAYDSSAGRRVPHLHMRVTGGAERLTAQMYFPEDAAANRGDGLYRALGAQAPLSVARADGAGRYAWDIVV